MNAAEDTKNRNHRPRHEAEALALKTVEKTRKPPTE